MPKKNLSAMDLLYLGSPPTVEDVNDPLGLSVIRKVATPKERKAARKKAIM